MAKIDKPQCQHCFGTNWNDLGVICDHAPGGEMFVEEHKVRLYQCGHGPAGAEEMNNGCSRVIMTTQDRMSKGGTI